MVFVLWYCSEGNVVVPHQNPNFEKERCDSKCLPGSLGEAPATKFDGSFLNLRQPKRSTSQPPFWPWRLTSEAPFCLQEVDLWGSFFGLLEFDLRAFVDIWNILSPQSNFGLVCT